MDRPRKPRRRRTLGDVAQDVKQRVYATKGKRKIKRTLKDKASSASKSVSNNREERRERLEGKSKGKRTVYKDSGQGFKTAKSVPTSRASRAKKTLGRMDNQDKRRLKKKLKY